MQSAAGRLRSPQSRWRSKRRWDAAWGHAWAALHRSGRAAICSPARTDPACVPTASTGIGWRTSSMVEPLDLTVELGRGLRLRSPVLVASGTFGYGFDAPQVDRAVLGAIVTKGTTLRAREGNAPNRIAETPSGMLNAIGLQNPGVDHVARVYAPVWASWTVPVIVNVAGEAIDEYVGVARRLEGLPGIAGLELNISCPNA